MPSISDRLKGGDRRSIGAADSLADLANKDRRTFDDLVDGLGNEDPLVRMRSADALEKASRHQSLWLATQAPALLAATHSDQPEVRWHIAQMAPRIRWGPGQRRVIIDWLSTCLNDDSMIVRTSALTSLVEMAASDPAMHNQAQEWLGQAATSSAASVRARARRLLRQFPALRAAQALGAKSTHANNADPNSRSH